MRGQHLPGTSANVGHQDLRHHRPPAPWPPGGRVSRVSSLFKDSSSSLKSSVKANCGPVLGRISTKDGIEEEQKYFSNILNALAVLVISKVTFWYIHTHGQRWLTLPTY